MVGQIGWVGAVIKHTGSWLIVTKHERLVLRWQLVGQVIECGPLRPKSWPLLLSLPARLTYVERSFGPSHRVTIANDTEVRERRWSRLTLAVGGVHRVVVRLGIVEILETGIGQNVTTTLFLGACIGSVDCLPPVICPLASEEDIVGYQIEE